MMIPAISKTTFKSTPNYSYINNQLFSQFIRPQRKQVAPLNNTEPIEKKIFFAGLGILLLGAGIIVGKKLNFNKTADELYRQTLANGLSQIVGKKIKINSLSSIAGKDELLKVLPTLKSENFIASSQNIQNGIFRADLHSHSIFSDGLGQVEDILTQVANYADKLNQKTGKKFYFALTDHNEIKGIQKALEYIAKEPDQFKNVRFIPGMEVSYAFNATNSSNAFEVAELLAYNINPFSSNVRNFVKNIHQKRNKMIKDFLSDAKNLILDTDFSFDEMKKFYPVEKTCLMNLQWYVHHYLQTKQGISKLAQNQNLNPENLYQEIMSQVQTRQKTLFALKNQNLIPEYIQENYEITRLAKDKYSTHLSNNIIDAPTENTFDDVINTFSKENSSWLAFAHPAYIKNNMNNLEETLNLLKELITKSKGLIKASESYHQAYKNNLVSNDTINLIQKHTNKFNLFDLGGRDSHCENWLNF